MKRVVVRSAPSETANVLRDEILATDPYTDNGNDEWFLGSEDDIMQSLGVSRPTLRQAARILEHEQLLTVRRGIGGGFFGRRPKADAVTHMSSVFLRVEGATFGQLIQTQILLGAACAEMAAANPDRSARTTVAEYYEKVLPDGVVGCGAAQFQEIAGEFQHVLARAAGNPCLTLFVSVLMDLARPVGVRIFSQPDNIKQTYVNHRKVANAVLLGKTSEASRLMRRHLELLVTWTDEQLRLRTIERPGAGPGMS
jgi:GntR family transcriptional repressor for pyruvate dehydrogenase complex